MGGDRHAVVFQDAAPVLHRPGRERRGEDLVEFAAMLDTITVVEEPCIGRELGSAKRHAQLLP